MQLTKEQEKVRDTKNKNILVSAAAGSGKTKVLVDRIIREITDPMAPVDVDRILVVTFTNAAAAEMRERIRKRIEKELAADSSNKNLRRQGTLIHNAQIRTIDSFCSWIVKNYFYEIDQDPTFRIGSKGELALISDRVLDDILKERFKEKNEDFLSLADAYISGRNFDTLKKMVFTLHTMAMSAPWPDEWYENCLASYDFSSKEEFEHSELIKNIVAETKAKCKEYKKKLNLALTFYEGLKDSTDKALLQSEFAMYESVLLAEGFDEIYAIVQGATYGTLRISKAVGENAEEVKSLRNSSKDGFKKLCDKYFGHDLQENFDSLMFVKSQANALVELAKDFSASLLIYKKKKNIYDFNDIEHMALEILRDANDINHLPRQVAGELSNYFAEIMVDEYQDSNELQEAILTAVCRDNNYFTVGDVKQSIYAFRQADPALFMDKFKSYILEERTDCERIDLDCNFRSRAQVLNFCNEVFAPLMQADMGNVTYDEAAFLKIGAKNYIGQEEMYKPEILIGGMSPEERSDLDLDSADELEATIIAKRIHELFEENFLVSEDDPVNEGKKILRPLRLSDIVILMRATSEHANTFMEVLKNNGIIAYVEEETGFFDRDEIQTLLSMLEIIDNPENDIPLAAVLHSKMFDISTEELAQIRANCKEGSLYSSILDYIEKSKNYKLIKFNEFLQEMRDVALDTSIHDIISRILRETGFGLYVAALPMGSAYKANIDKLVDEAVRFEATGNKSISKFVEHINNLKTYKEELGLAKTVSENDDAVRIMTIHKSKGLEFPVVFLARASAGFNNNAKDQVFYYPGLGIGMNYKNPASRVSHELLLTNIIKQNIKADSLGEEQRILYVALTRAKEKIIVVGDLKPTKNATVQDIVDGYFKELNPTISYETKFNTSSYLEWILRSLCISGGIYDLKILEADELILNDAIVQTKKSFMKKQVLDFISLAENEDSDFISAAVNNHYHSSIQESYKAKYSVSEIKHTAMAENFVSTDDSEKLFSEPEESSYIPMFMRKNTSEDSQETPAGALYGTAMHRFLECFDFTREDYAGSVDSQFEYMKKVNSLSEDQCSRLRIKKLKNFINSDLAERMHIASINDDLFKEQPFVLKTSVDNLFSDSKDKEVSALVQGIIDAFFIEDNQIVLLDYKTDRVDEPQTLMLRYEKQLRLYEDALIRATGLKVKDVLIYSFCLDKTISLGA